MEHSKFLNLNWGDVARSLVVAILAGFALPLLAAVQTPGFDIANANWPVILNLAFNGGIAAAAGYLTKNVLTTEDGKFLGKVG